MTKNTIQNRAIWCVAVLSLYVGLVSLLGTVPQAPHKTVPQPLQAAIIIPAAPVAAGIQPVLSESDRALYADAFKAQRAFDWNTANDALAQTQNPLLKGHVLAERYLNRKYTTNSAELEAWLAEYRDLPQAFDIYQLARRKFSSETPAVEKSAMLTVRGDDNGLAANFDESKYFTTWREGINAYRAGKLTKAAEMFDKMLADRDALSPWKVSAAGFWSWRSHTQLGDHKKAMESLQVAASEPRSFYGILARKQLGQKLELSNSNLALSAAELKHLAQYPAYVRATALVEANRSDLAERELRILYNKVPRADHYAMLRLAHQLSLPALQIALAKRLETKGDRLDIARYPIPEWQPVGGFSVDPALIYALVRQESGFRSGAISPAGAMGLMQLMPSTASMMTNKLGAFHINGATEAEKNVSLGQSYVRHLLENQLVDNNMIYMLAAYNAGIGRLQDWKRSIDYRNDPLLFIERMPFAETRHYIMQVMTNYWVYNEILGISSPSLAALAENRWPVYVAAKDIT